jgi:hypothetical protein
MPVTKRSREKLNQGMNAVQAARALQQFGSKGLPNLIGVGKNLGNSVGSFLGGNGFAPQAATTASTGQTLGILGGSGGASAGLAAGTQTAYNTIMAGSVANSAAGFGGGAVAGTTGATAGFGGGVAAGTSGATAGFGGGAALGTTSIGATAPAAGIGGLGAASIGGAAGLAAGAMYGISAKETAMNRTNTSNRKQQTAYDATLGVLENNKNIYKAPNMATGGPIQGFVNIEKGELGLDKKGEIVQEYMGDLFSPHSKNGKDPENNIVNAEKVNFIIPKKFSKKYLEGDAISRSTIIRQVNKDFEAKQGDASFRTGGPVMSYKNGGPNKAYIKNEIRTGFGVGDLLKIKENEIEGASNDYWYNKSLTEEERQKYGGAAPSGHNDTRDALRHGYSSMIMADEYGLPASLAAGAYHEAMVPNDWGETSMDMYNNVIGAGVGAIPFASQDTKAEWVNKLQRYGAFKEEPFGGAIVNYRENQANKSKDEEFDAFPGSEDPRGMPALTKKHFSTPFAQPTEEQINGIKGFRDTQDLINGVNKRGQGGPIIKYNHGGPHKQQSMLYAGDNLNWDEYPFDDNLYQQDGFDPIRSFQGNTKEFDDGTYSSGPQQAQMSQQSYNPYRMTGAQRINNNPVDINNMGGTNNGDFNNILNAAPSLYNIGQGLFGKPDTFEANYNPNEAAVRAGMSKGNTDINLDQTKRDLHALANRSKGDVNNISSSVGSNISRRRAIDAQLGRGLSRANQEAQQINSQNAFRRAGMEDSLGQQRVAANERQRELNLLTKSNQAQFLGEGLTGLSGYMQSKSQDGQLMGVLQGMYPNLAKYLT